MGGYGPVQEVVGEVAWLRLWRLMDLEREVWQLRRSWCLRLEVQEQEAPEWYRRPRVL